MEKHVDVYVALFALALAVLLSTQVVIRDANGEGSPVTCVVLTNPPVSAVASNFTVTVDPASAKVIPGDTATFDVSVMSKDKEPEAISLNVTGLPDGISAIFDPPNGTTDFESTLTITVDEMICPGVYAPSIVARDINVQLAEFRLEVAGAGSIREALEDEIAALNAKIDEFNTKIDDFERKRDGQFDISGGYLAITLVAIIGSFLLAAFALFVLLRHLKSTNSPAPATMPATMPAPTPSNNNGKLQEIVFLLRQLIESMRRPPQIIYEPKPETKGEVEKPTKKEPATEAKVGDVWYAYCQICGLQTEHGRDYQGEFCARCGNRSA